MKWTEVDRSRVSLLQGRHYPPTAAKSRRRHIAQETKDKPVPMHHQFYVDYNNVQSGTMLDAKRVLRSIVINYD